MKDVFAFLGMFIGSTVGSIIADSLMVRLSIGIIFSIVGYQLPGFIRYVRSSPKQLLAYHGPDAPISRSRSLGELKAFWWQLHEGGLLLDFRPNDNYAEVDGGQWVNLTEHEKVALAQVLMQAQAVDGAAVGNVRILGRDGTLLANYSTSERDVP